MPFFNVSDKMVTYTCIHMCYTKGISLFMQILASVMDVERPSSVTRMSGDVEMESSEEEREKIQRERDQTTLVVGKLTQPCLDRLESSLSNNTYETQTIISINKL